MKQVAQLLEAINDEHNSFIIITHLFEMLQNLPLEQILILERGKIKEIGGRELIEQVRNSGF